MQRLGLSFREDLQRVFRSFEMRSEMKYAWVLGLSSIRYARVARHLLASHKPAFSSFR